MAETSYEEELFKQFVEAYTDGIVDEELVTEMMLTFPKMYTIEVYENDEGQQFAILSLIAGGNRKIISGKKEDVFHRGGI